MEDGEDEREQNSEDKREVGERGSKEGRMTA